MTDYERIIADIASKFNVNPNGRKSEAVVVKKALVVFFIDDCGLNYSQVGRLLKRDHTTIIYLYQQGKFELSNYWDIRKVYDNIKTRVNYGGV